MSTLLPDPDRAPSGVLSEPQREALRAFVAEQVAAGERVVAAAHQRLVTRPDLPRISYQAFYRYFREAVEADGASGGGAPKAALKAETPVTRLPVAPPPVVQREDTASLEPAEEEPATPARRGRSHTGAPVLRMERGPAEFSAHYAGGEWRVEIRGPLPNDAMLKWAALFQLQFFPAGGSAR